MMRPSAMIGGTAKTASFRRRPAMLLATASAIALLCHAPRATAQTCGGAPPADIATPAALYETLRDRTDAQLLAIGFAQQPADCAWVYEVKMLTVSGSVVELDFAARGLDLIGVRGPDNDKEVAKLVRGLGGNTGTIVSGGTKGDGSGQDGSGGDNDEGGGSGSGSGGSGGGDGGEGSEGGEGGNSGSGSGNSGSGAGEGGEGSGSGNSGSGGGEGGEGGGSGSSGGGEGGDD